MFGYIVCMVIGGFIGYLIMPVPLTVCIGIFIGWLFWFIIKNTIGDLGDLLDIDFFD